MLSSVPIAHTRGNKFNSQRAAHFLYTEGDRPGDTLSARYDRLRNLELEREVVAGQGTALNTKVYFEQAVRYSVIQNSLID